eukprot:6455106-Amphidinium_carterae.1
MCRGKQATHPAHAAHGAALSLLIGQARKVEDERRLVLLAGPEAALLHLQQDGVQNTSNRRKVNLLAHASLGGLEVGALSTCEVKYELCSILHLRSGTSLMKQQLCLESNACAEGSKSPSPRSSWSSCVIMDWPSEQDGKQNARKRKKVKLLAHASLGGLGGAALSTCED